MGLSLLSGRVKTPLRSGVYWKWNNFALRTSLKSRVWYRNSRLGKSWSLRAGNQTFHSFSFLSRCPPFVALLAESLYEIVHSWTLLHSNEKDSFGLFLKIPTALTIVRISLSSSHSNRLIAVSSSSVRLALLWCADMGVHTYRWAIAGWLIPWKARPFARASVEASVHFYAMAKVICQPTPLADDTVASWFETDQRHPLTALLTLRRDMLQDCGDLRVSQGVIEVSLGKLFLAHCVL